jgi:glycine cleavage system transcriptional repressor
MSSRFIMTAFGKDRPGIVADVTCLLYENGCNLEETTMTMLADEFTLSLLFSCPQGDIEEQLIRDCRRLERDKAISAFVRPLASRSKKPTAGGSLCVLHVEGLDQAGIVYKTSRFLADHNINIVDLKSTVMEAPGSGAAIYVMDIHTRIPEDLTKNQLEEQLSAVADDLNVDISLTG